MPAITITLKDRVKMYAEAVRTCDDKLVALTTERAGAFDQLALAEAEVLGKAPGWEDAEVSGMIAEGENPHYEPPTHATTSKERAAQHQEQRLADEPPPAQIDLGDEPDTGVSDQPIKGAKKEKP